MSLKNKVAVNTAVDTFGRVFQLIIGSITIIILTRYLGPEGYGYYALILAFVGMFSDISGLGINMTIARKIPNEPKLASDIFANALSLKTLGSIIIFGSAIIIGILIYPEPVVRTGIILAGLSSAFLTIQGTYKPIYQIKLKLKNFVIADVVSRSISFILLLLFVYSGYSLNYIIATLTLGSLINLLLTDFFARKLIDVSWKIDLKGWQMLVKEAFFLALIVILGGIMQKISIVILSKLDSPEEVGFYELALRPIVLIYGLAMLFTSLIYPILAKMVNSNLERLKNILRQSNDFLILAGLLLGLFFFFFDKQLILIFGGNEFIRSANILKLLSFILVLRFSYMIFFNYLIVKRFDKYLAKIHGLGLIIVSLLSLFLIPKMGAMGAAWAFLIGEIFVALAIFIATRKIIVATKFAEDYLGKIPLTALTAIAYYFINQLDLLKIETFGSYSILVRMAIILLILLLTSIPVIVKFKNKGLFKKQLTKK